VPHPPPAATRTRRRALQGACAVLAAAALSSGCGFQLRSSAALPFKTLYVEFPPNSAVGAEFRRLVRVAADTRLVDRPEDAQARLIAYLESREKEIVGFTTTGRPREYQIRLRFGFRLLDDKQAELIAPTELLLRREITTSDTELVAKELEEVLIYREMQTDLVQQLLRRLAAVKR
jgi:LPS-assembly lipoprotein